MSLEQKIMSELKTAMLAKDEKSVRSLRAIKAAIIVAKTAEGAKGEIGETEEVRLLQKMVKQRKDSLEIFTQQGRPELAAKEQEEIEIIERFLPRQMSETEIKEAVQAIIRDAGASSRSLPYLAATPVCRLSQAHQYVCQEDRTTPRKVRCVLDCA